MNSITQGIEVASYQIILVNFPKPEVLQILVFYLLIYMDISICESRVNYYLNPYFLGKCKNSDY